MIPEPISFPQRELLRAVSAQLLQLHKLLLDRQRAEYERAYGPIGSVGEFLNLVLEHPSFAWLRQLSGLIVQIDEARAPRSKALASDASAALERAIQLLVPDEAGTPFQQRYAAELQASPDVLLAHREIVTVLKGGGVRS